MTKTHGKGLKTVRLKLPATTEDLVALASEQADTDLTTWADTWLEAPQPPYRTR